MAQRTKNPALSLHKLWLRAVVRVRSLPRELPYALDVAKKKKKDWYSVFPDFQFCSKNVKRHAGSHSGLCSYGGEEIL